MKFIADAMLGKLAKSLRIYGWDAVYYNGPDKCRLMETAKKEGRVILTRDTSLRSKIKFTTLQLVFINDDNPIVQLRELVLALKLRIDPVKLFSRCLRCNKVLEKVLPEKVEGKVPLFVWQHHREYSRCPLCRRIYWRGTHIENMLKKVEDFPTINDSTSLIEKK